MSKISFLFLGVFLIIVSVFAGLESVDMSFQLFGALISITLLGIPHGAIDHIIFLEDNNTAKPLHFYGFYFGLIGLYLLGWALFPMWGLLFFLVMSAYHFGQAQFSELSINKSFGKHILYFAWGTSILSALTLYNFEEIISICALSPDLFDISAIFNKSVFTILLPLSSIVTLSLLFFILKKKQISTERFFFEIYLLILIHVCFYILPLVVGFTLYFVILHSLKVLGEEFQYLKSRRTNFTLRSFIKLLIPFSSISIAGGGIIMICSHFELIGISKVLLVFVLISVLTLPHSFVMDNFYQKFMKKAS